MKKNLIRKLLFGFISLLTVCWIAGMLLLISDAKNAQVPSSNRVVVTSEGASTTPSIEIKKTAHHGEPRAQVPVKTESAPTNSTSSLPIDALVDPMSTTLTIDAEQFVHQLERGSTVLTLLDTAVRSGEITYVGKNYSGLGLFIDNIALGTTTASGHHTWTYFVNGTLASVGASAYVLHDGDVVLWKSE